MPLIVKYGMSEYTPSTNLKNLVSSVLTSTTTFESEFKLEKITLNSFPPTPEALFKTTWTSKFNSSLGLISKVDHSLPL